MATLFQFKLKEVLVMENGEFEEGIDGANSLSATLYYPKEGVPALTSIRSMSLKDSVPYDYTEEDYKKQLVFKEEIKGDTMFEVEISAIDKATKFEKLIVKLLGVAAGAAIGTVTGIGAVVTAVASSASESIFEMAEPSDKIHVIGRGARLINEDTPNGEFIIQLAVPKDITLSFKRKNDAGDIEYVRATLSKGKNNAQVKFDITRIE